MPSSLELVVGAVLAALASGCVMSRIQIDHPLEEEKIARLERGVTTKAEVLALFGPPQEIDGREVTILGMSAEALYGVRPTKPAPERMVTARFFRYQHVRANVFGTLTVVFNFFDFDVKRDVLIVFFDGDDKVEDFAFRRDSDLLPALGPLSR